MIHLQCRRPGLTPRLGTSPGGGNDYLLQYSCLGNSMDRGAWCAMVHGLQRVRHNWDTNSRTLRGFSGDSVVKNLPANAGDWGSIPGWGRSPGEGNGNPLQCSCMENPTDGGGLVGYSPWDCKESNMTEWAHTSHTIILRINNMAADRTLLFSAWKSRKWLSWFQIHFFLHHVKKNSTRIILTQQTDGY